MASHSVLVAVLLQATASALVAPRVRVRRAALRADGGEDAPEAAAAERDIPEYKKPGRYDVSKLVGGGDPDETGGFNQFDPVLTATQGLSRRFGIVGGLSVVALLLAVEGGEIVDGLTKAAPEAGANVEVALPSGLRYTESLVGRRGQTPLPGAVIGLDATVSIGDRVIFSTKDDKPVAWKYGQRPFQNVICDGVEEGIRGMRVGGRRRLVVPAALAPAGVALPDGVPLVYDVELTEVLPGYF